MTTTVLVKHRTEVLNTDQGHYAICSCGWHSKQGESHFAARIAANSHRVGEALKTSAPPPKVK